MEPPELAAIRREYTARGLTEDEAGDDPLVLLRQWIAEAVAAGIDEPNAMAVATADARGRPSVRTVLLKGIDIDGAVFYTNLESRKARELAENPWAAAVLLWRPLQRQVRIEGPALPVSDDEADRYFESRPRGAQISAAASQQSEPIDGRDDLERQYTEVEQAAAGGDLARPSFWGGYRLGFDSIEFWQGRPNRLHDRIRFVRGAAGWKRERLQP
ncbi:MAG TPA: pyridoxamine 5'-phosphate oxidase [Aeromicrobium sp.]|nr:pyridoxamine 5'-phosphate oxidase [Aeromicrobium sp.]